ncbi:very short patch repair endonuclease [Parafilimonas sp.]|uniref:very short patch repair endonuclease n=1 Tax=Parafilimonas sp. TaxID=1969739 RepID=UPI003F7F1F0F
MNKHRPYRIIEEEIIKVPRFEEEGGFYATAKSSAVMSKIRSKNTKAEILLRKVLWNNGCRYRLHAKGLLGKPDIIFVKQKIVVFVDGDFWHGYNWEEKKKKLISNKAYWIPKIERNIQRDIEVTNLLTQNGWLVIRFWEHDVQKQLSECVEKVLSLIKGRRGKF